MNTRTKLLSALIGAGIITAATLTYAARPWYSCLSPKHIKTTKAECFASCTAEQRVWNEADGTCDPKEEGFICQVKCVNDSCVGGTYDPGCSENPNTCCILPKEGETFCATNSDCSTEEYCNYDGSLVPRQPPIQGVCKTISKTLDGNGFVHSNSMMDWYSAKNFCARVEGVSGLVTMDEFCPGGWSDESCSGKRTTLKGDTWTASEHGSTSVYFMYKNGAADTDDKGTLGYTAYALCK